jgi:hypothetical protein
LGALLGALLAPLAAALASWFPVREKKSCVLKSRPWTEPPKFRFRFSEAPHLSVPVDEIPGGRENFYDLTLDGKSAHVMGEHASMSSNQTYGYWQPKLEGIILRGIKA